MVRKDKKKALPLTKGTARPRRNENLQASLGSLANTRLPIVMEQSDSSPSLTCIPSKLVESSVPHPDPMKRKLGEPSSQSSFRILKKYKPVATSISGLASELLTMDDKSSNSTKAIQNRGSKDDVNISKKTKVPIVIEPKVNKSNSRSNILSSKKYSNSAISIDNPFASPTAKIKNFDKKYYAQKDTETSQLLKSKHKDHIINEPFSTSTHTNRGYQQKELLKSNYSRSVHPNPSAPTPIILDSSKYLKNSKTKSRGDLKENALDNILPSSKLLYDRIKILRYNSNCQHPINMR